MNTTTRSIPKRLSLVAALAVAAAITLTACSSDPGSDGRSSSDSSTSSKRESGNAFAQCLRDKGYDAEDPSAGDGSGLSAIPDGVDKDQYNRDVVACSEQTSSGAEDVQEVPKAEADAFRGKLAACLRENGFADYPDDADAAAEWTAPDENEFLKAQQECAKEIAPDSSFGTNS